MNSTTGLLTGVAIGNTDITVMAAASASVVATNTQETPLTLWDTCVIGTCPGGGTPGGTNTPASYAQTGGIASPSLSGASLEITETTLATSTQTNFLNSYQTTSCNSCRYFQADFWVYPTLAAASSARATISATCLKFGSLSCAG